MENSIKNNSCTTWCWLIAAAVGIITTLVLWKMREWGFVPGAFFGFVIFIIGGALLSWLFCKPVTSVTEATTSSATSNSAASTAAASAVAGGSVAATAAGAAFASTDSADTTAKRPGVKPSAELAGTKELAERKGDWKYEKPEEAKPVTKKAEANKAPAKKAAAAKTTKTAAKTKAAGSDAKASKAPAAEPATAKATTAKDTTTKAAPKATTKAAASPEAVTAKSATTAKTAKPKAAATKVAKTAAAKPIAADGKPETLTKARAGGADDLKQLKGVGPGLEKTLNELGFYHFDQVASWRKKEIEWVDGNLRFKGRIERDEWIKQAKVLAKGGTTEFSSKVKKGGVY